MKAVIMKPVVQKPRKDGFWIVYIRFTYDGHCQFYKTSKVVSSHYVVSKSEITDPYVLTYCNTLILEWMERLNHVDYSTWKIKEIIDYVRLLVKLYHLVNMQGITLRRLSNQGQRTTIFLRYATLKDIWGRMS